MRYLIFIALLLGVSLQGATAQESTLVSVTSPDLTRTIRINLDPLPVIGSIDMSAEEADFWKVDIRGRSRRSAIGDDPLQRIWGYEWTTIASGTETIENDVITLLPPFPTLTEGRWFARIVVVGADGSFLEEPFEFEFRSQPDFDPVLAVIESPTPNQVVPQEAPVLVSLGLNFLVSGYEIEIIGGQYADWTRILYEENNEAEPIERINSQVLALPPDLQPGRYRLKLTVFDRDGFYIQTPAEVQFAVETDEFSSLAEVVFTEPRRVMLRRPLFTSEPTDIIGSVTIPPTAQYYKVDILDDFNPRNPRGQEARFTDWTTLVGPVYEGVSNGTIVSLPGPDVILPGRYVIRVVVVDNDGNFATEERFDLRMEAPE